MYGNMDTKKFFFRFFRIYYIQIYLYVIHSVNGELVAICRPSALRPQITPTCSIIPTNESRIEVIYQSYKHLLAAEAKSVSLMFLRRQLLGGIKDFFESRYRHNAIIFFQKRVD